ncbi:16S rRNA (uracil(1498)-N(3))-methyltransferase [Pedobacter sp. JY14-1]|uniref:16S rRNA (uracil(1498)-N(3))-methyltransferase n=1 Tax=Pedobacter sp. JY14-1 TaxID=3034151 RepID=UPI0023E30006|nr:16S rRNA (uracil(1498)-N(3))-methyltransferase [Pedobacter sp. JY14-1]
MHVFYTPDIRSEEYLLNEEESRHCMKVLRLGVGAEVHLIDGRGGLYKARIIEESKKNVRLAIIETTLEYHKRQHYLHIAVAPTKNIDRLEWFLEKATEIGIDEVTPVICDRSERKIVKDDRLNKIITSAVKQSLQAYHPKLNAATDLDAFLKKQGVASERMIAHCLEDQPRNYIRDITQPGQHYTLLIGPEGDFTQQEIDQALRTGYKPVTLGENRLRTETAALAACLEINFLNR